MESTICFAYFGDGKFIGWYADTWGSVRNNSPKLYNNNEKMIGIITENFRNKMNKLNEPSDISLPLLSESLNKDKTNLKQYKHIELRIVECPYYDGPNPDFDKEAWDKLMDKRHEHMRELGIFDIPAPSKARSEAVRKYDQDYPSPKCDNWIYADYDEVQKWASNEPTKFIGTICVL